MAHLVVTYIVMAYIGMAHLVVTYIVMAYMAVEMVVTGVWRSR